MLTEKLQENLFKLVYSLENLNKKGYFDFLIKCAHMYRNYEFLIVAEINTSEKDIIDENSDIVKIAENIVNRKEIETSVYELNKVDCETICIAKINNKGFTLFPNEDPEAIKIELKNKYRRYIGLERFLKELNKMEEQEKNEMIKTIRVELEEYLLNNPLVSEVGNEPVKDQYNDKYEITGCLTMDPSTFYFLNEIAEDSFHPGIWFDYVNMIEDSHMCTDQYDEIEKVEDIENIDVFDYDLEITNDGLLVIQHLFSISKIKVFIDARLDYIGEVLFERISQIFNRNLINKNLRGFHNGNYCPIDKSKLLASLSYSPDLKITIDMLVKCYDSLPYPELKEGLVKHVWRMFKERGSTAEIEITEKLFEEVLNTKNEVLAMKNKIEEGKQRTEAVLAQIFKKIYPTIPSFCIELYPEHRERYLKNLIDISMIIIKKLTNPIENGETSKYKDIFSSFGLLVGNIVTYFLYGGNPPKEKDITISNIRDSYEIRMLLQKLGEKEKEVLYKYSEKYGKIYNDIRHADVNTSVSYDKTENFIIDSHKVIKMVVKNKQKFTQ